MFKNITLSADGSLIRKARQCAAGERKSLNALFREWIARYMGADGGGSEKYRQLMKHLNHVQPGRSFSREKMNER